MNFKIWVEQHNPQENWHDKLTAQICQLTRLDNPGF